MKKKWKVNDGWQPKMASWNVLFCQNVLYLPYMGEETRKYPNLKTLHVFPKQRLLRFNEWIYFALIDLIIDSDGYNESFIEELFNSASMMFKEKYDNLLWIHFSPVFKVSHRESDGSNQRSGFHQSAGPGRTLLACFHRKTNRDVGCTVSHIMLEKHITPCGSSGCLYLLNLWQNTSHFVSWDLNENLFFLFPFVSQPLIVVFCPILVMK